MVVGKFRILKFAAGMSSCLASILAESRLVDLVVFHLPMYLKMLGDCIADRKVAVCQLLTFSVRRRKEVRQRIRSTDVTDVKDRRKKAF